MRVVVRLPVRWAFMPCIIAPPPAGGSGGRLEGEDREAEEKGHDHRPDRPFKPFDPRRRLSQVKCGRPSCAKPSRLPIESPGGELPQPIRNPVQSDVAEIMLCPVTAAHDSFRKGQP